jgi:hypothetical protein
MTAIEPIPQWYDGIKFRSTLEARWAVFFDAAGIRWDYEPEGFVVGGKAYRPDFLLRDCGTWVEVKGDPARLDLELMGHAAHELPRPRPKYEGGPALLLLGNLPPPMTERDGDCPDWGFVGLNKPFPEDVAKAAENSGISVPQEPVVEFTYWGFGSYSKNLRPWWLYSVDPLPSDIAIASRVVLEPWLCEWEPGIHSAYATARAYRFGRR